MARDHTHDTATHATLGRKAHLQGKFTRTIVHAAGSHGGIDMTGISGRKMALSRTRIYAMVRQNQSDIGQILACHPNRTCLKITVQDLLHRVMDHAVGLQHIGKGSVLVACLPFGTKYGFIHLQQKHFNEAIEYLSKALSFDNELKEAYEDRAKAYRALEKFDLAEADEAKAAVLEAAQKGNP